MAKKKPSLRSLLTKEEVTILRILLQDLQKKLEVIKDSHERWVIECQIKHTRNELAADRQERKQIKKRLHDERSERQYNKSSRDN